MVEAVRSARRWWALGALVVSVLVVGLDGTVINVAVPTLARELGAGSTVRPRSDNSHRTCAPLPPTPDRRSTTFSDKDGG